MKHYIKYQVILILSILLNFFSCEKDDNSKFQIEINNPYNFDVEIRSSLIESDILGAGFTKTYTGTPGEGSLYGVDSNCEDDCLILGEQGNYSDGVTVFNFEENESYTWTIGNNSILSTTSSNNSIIGKWINLNGCTNANNEQTYFEFNSDSSGIIFNSDCNNVCSGFGYYLYFTWIDTNNSVTLSYTSVSEYCDVQTPTPDDETLDYSINGNQLSLGGTIWTKD